MLRLIITIMLSALCAPSFAAVMAYSVADDNFEMPDHLVQIDLETGDYVSMGQIADPYIALEGLAMSADGILYGADDNTKTLVQIIPSEARAFPVANANQNFGFGSIPESYDFGMSFACDNKLYMVVKHTQELYEVNATTGEATLIGNTAHNFTSLASWGDELYSIASGEFTRAVRFLNELVQREQDYFLSPTIQDGSILENNKRGDSEGKNSDSRVTIIPTIKPRVTPPVT